MNIQSKNLLNAVKSVKVNTVQSLPILNHALIEAKDGTMRVTTADFSKDKPQFNRAQCEVQNGFNFSVCVPMVHYAKVNYDKNMRHTHKKRTLKTYPLYDIVNVLCEQFKILDIEYIHNTCEIVIKSGRSKSTIKCMDAQEFPTMTQPVD